MTASPEEPPLVTSGLRVSVQPAKPTLPIMFLYRVTTFMCFLHIRCSRLFVLLFSDRISHFKILSMPKIYVLCSLLTQTQGSLAFPVVWK